MVSSTTVNGLDGLTGTGYPYPTRRHSKTGSITVLLDAPGRVNVKTTVGRIDVSGQPNLCSVISAPAREPWVRGTHHTRTLTQTHTCESDSPNRTFWPCIQHLSGTPPLTVQHGPCGGDWRGACGWVGAARAIITKLRWLFVRSLIVVQRVLGGLVVVQRGLRGLVVVQRGLVVVQRGLFCVTLGERVQHLYVQLVVIHTLRFELELASFHHSKTGIHLPQHWHLYAYTHTHVTLCTEVFMSTRAHRNWVSIHCTMPMGFVSDVRVAQSDAQSCPHVRENHGWACFCVLPTKPFQCCTCTVHQGPSGTGRAPSPT